MIRNDDASAHPGIGIPPLSCRHDNNNTNNNNTNNNNNNNNNNNTNTNNNNNNTIYRAVPFLTLRPSPFAVSTCCRFGCRRSYRE